MICWHLHNDELHFSLHSIIYHVKQFRRKNRFIFGWSKRDLSKYQLIKCSFDCIRKTFEKSRFSSRFILHHFLCVFTHVCVFIEWDIAFILKCLLLSNCHRFCFVMEMNYIYSLSFKGFTDISTVALSFNFILRKINDSIEQKYFRLKSKPWTMDLVMHKVELAIFIYHPVTQDSLRQ